MISRPPVLIEAAVDSQAAALAAEAAGADRLELCGDLDAGGVTPPATLLERVLATCRIPVFVMIRPRPGSFVYSPAEVETMVAGISLVRGTSASGIVTGALHNGRTIHASVLRALVAAAGPLPVTFHRAFDEVADSAGALEVLAALGIRRVLTSGGAATAEAGVPAIAGLVRRAAGRLEVIAGGGVTGANAGEIVSKTGVRELHARCGPDGQRIRDILERLEAGAAGEQS